MSHEKGESTFYPKLPDFQKSIAFLEDRQAPPVCPSGTSNMWTKMSVQHRWDGSDRGKTEVLEKHLSSATLSTTVLT